VEDVLALSNVEGDIDVIRSDVAVRAIRDVFYSGSSAQMGRELGILPSQVVHFAAGSFPAPLQLFVRASYTTGATMRQLIVTNQFEPDASRFKRRGFETRRLVPRRNELKKELFSALTEALSGDGSVSVAAIAASFNIAAITVWRRERDLASRLSLRHAEYVAKQTQQEKEQYRERVVAFLKTCAGQGMVPSRREVDKQCDGVGRFSSDWKRTLIRLAMTEVFETPASVKINPVGVPNSPARLPACSAS
jgi:hypothetical protein